MRKVWWSNTQANQVNNKRFWPHQFKEDLETRMRQSRGNGHDIPLGEMTMRVGSWIYPSIKTGRYDKTYQLVDALTCDPSSHLLISHPDVGAQVKEGLVNSVLVGATHYGFNRLQSKILVSNSIQLLHKGGEKGLLMKIAFGNFDKPHIVPAVMIAMAQDGDWEAVRQMTENVCVQDGHREL